MLRKGILAHSYHDLINKCKDKFMTADHPVKLVLDTDGVEIDEDFFIVLPGNTVLMLLKGEEMWMPQNSAPQDNSSTAKTTAVTASGSTTGNKQSNLLEVVSLVRRKRNEKTTGREHFMSHNKKTPQRKAFVKISLGWLYHDGFRYIQIRSANGGGTRVVDMKWESSYTDILERAKELFFPNNTSPKGHWDSFHNKLGDFKQNVIVSAEFTLQKYVEKNCLTLKPRIYLMSKEILEDKDFELPDLLETGMSDVDIQIMTDSSSDEQNDVTIPDVPSDVITSDVNFSSRQEAPSSSASPNQNIATSAYIQTYYSSDVNTTARQDSMSTSSSGHSQITASQDIQNNNSIIDPDLTLPYNPDHSYNTDMMTSPVVVNTPSIPSCSVCSDRFCDAFLTCGHIICYVCAVELEERGSLCPVCRVTFSKISKLFY